MGMHHHVPSQNVKSEDMDIEEELLLKWDDHHRSFFELAEDLCHQEQFIDVTLSCGEHNFPAHKLILSVCSPYFRQLFLRNPCKHPIVVLKDVHFKYMKLLLMYMYRGEVSCPHEDLSGLLRTARSLQIRGLVELERKREAEGLTNSLTGSPIKGPPSDLIDAASTTSEECFSLDDVRSRLHGQLEIQPISQPSSSTIPTWQHDTVNKAAATSTNAPEMEDERLPHHYQKLRKWSDNNGTDLSMQRHGSPLSHSTASHNLGTAAPPRKRSRSSSSSHAAQLYAATGLPPTTRTDTPNNPMSSMNALIAAAQAHSNNLPASTLSSLLPASSSSSPSINSNSTPPAAGGSGSGAVAAAASSTAVPPASAAATAPTGGTATSLASEGTNVATSATGTTGGSNGQAGGVAAAVANLQLYYYMQKVASAGMGNPKERKECPICGKTLYDRSTWNRHMRIHTGEKPYPCRFCGRRFRTNYNKIGHEKKCPDRQLRPLVQSSEQASANTTTDATTTNNESSNNAARDTSKGQHERAVYR